MMKTRLLILISNVNNQLIMHGWSIDLADNLEIGKTNDANWIIDVDQQCRE